MNYYSNNDDLKTPIKYLPGLSSLPRNFELRNHTPTLRNRNPPAASMRANY